MPGLAYINPKGALARDAVIVDARTKIMEKLAEIPEYHLRKMDLELLTLACIACEHLIDNKKLKVKVDKKDLVLQVYTRLYNGISPADLKIIEANIQYLWDNGKIIKKSLWSICKHSIADWFHRKIVA